MDSIINIIILFFFLLEVYILFKLEKVLWGTNFTPLNILMVPYTAVLLITISLPSSLGFVPFYYPSILVWSIGLIIFFLPSLLFGIICRREKDHSIVITEPKSIHSLYVIAIILIVASMFYLFFFNRGSEEMLGSEEFASATLKRGVWAHIREALLALMIILIYFFKSNKFIFYPIIAGILIVAVVYQVLSWILIPIVAGLIIRFFAGKSTLKLKNVLYVVAGGIIMFFFSYYLVLVFAVDDGEFNTEMLEMIYKHFLFYLTSGISSLSVDIQQGILETPNPESIFAPFLNIIYALKGNDLVSPINPVYLYIGWTSANVRTFFGTLYINLGVMGAAFYVFFISSLLYLVLLWLKKRPNLWALGYYGLMTALLFMGWFEFYYFHLVIIEMPLFMLIYSGLLYLRLDNNNDSPSIELNIKS